MPFSACAPRSCTLRPNMLPTNMPPNCLHSQARSFNAAARERDRLCRRTGHRGTVRQAGRRLGLQLVIRDTKTSAKSPVPSFLDGNDKAGTADDSEQLTAYAVASHVVDGRLPDKMVLDYLVRTNAAKANGEICADCDDTHHGRRAGISEPIHQSHPRHEDRECLCRPTRVGGGAAPSGADSSIAARTARNPSWYRSQKE